MRTEEKDILKICKGYYNRDKFSNKREAIIAYYVKEYDVEEVNKDYITDEFLINLFLSNCVKEFLNEKTKASFCEHVLKGKSKDIDNENNDFYKNLFDRIVSWMHLLKVREENKWIIDLSDYDDADII